MKNTLVIARRELTEKRFVFVTAIAFAVLTLIVPFMPSIHVGERRNAMAVASLLFCGGFTLGLAVILGSTIIGRELSEGRLSFYFSKPLSPASIWFGKLIAATLLIVVSFAIIGLPASIVGFGKVVRTWTNLGDSLLTMRIILAAAAALFLLGHVIGTFVRSRSAWLVFDFIAAAICGSAIWLMGRALLEGTAVNLTRHLAIILGIFAAIVIIAAGLWQVARGRTDRKRSHIEMSRFLWMALGSGLLVVAGFTAWVVSVSFEDVSPEYVEQSGQWAVIAGKAKHRDDYRAAFLFNVNANRAMRLSRFQPWWGIQFADSAVAWLMPTVGGHELYTANLDDARPRPIATGIVTHPVDYTISKDGSRAVIVERDGIVTVYDIAKHASIGSVRIPTGRYHRVIFATNDLLRVYAHREPRIDIFEYNVPNRILQKTGELPYGNLQLSRDLTRVMMYRKRPGLEIYDARSGALLLATTEHVYTARFLKDGRIITVSEADRSTVQILSSQGAVLHAIKLPAKADWSPSFSNGLAVIVFRNSNAVHQPAFAAAVIDVDRGVVLRTELGVQPMYANDSPQLLCYDQSRNVIVWNPATGEKRLIAKAS